MIEFILLSGMVLWAVASPRQCRHRLQGRNAIVKTASKASNHKGKTSFDKDRRRKHHHFLVTVFYADGEKFGRVYTDKDKAERFADRQRRSPVVKMARVSQVS